MTREELLQILQEKGLSDDDIKLLLQETLDTLSKDFADADEDAEKKKAQELLGVSF